MNGGTEPLADLLRALPPPPESWVLSARQIFEPDDAAGSDDGAAEDFEEAGLSDEQPPDASYAWDEGEPDVDDSGGDEPGGPFT